MASNNFSMPEGTSRRLIFNVFNTQRIKVNLKNYNTHFYIIQDEEVSELPSEVDNNSIIVVLTASLTTGITELKYECRIESKTNKELVYKVADGEITIEPSAVV